MEFYGRVLFPQALLSSEPRPNTRCRASSLLPNGYFAPAIKMTPQVCRVSVFTEKVARRGLASDLYSVND